MVKFWLQLAIIFIIDKVELRPGCLVHKMAENGGK